MIADWREYGESAFAVRVLEILPYGMRMQDAQKAELRWQVHFARLGCLYNAPKCTLCGRPLKKFASTDPGVDVPDAAGSVLPPLAAHEGRQRKAKRGQNRPYASPHPSSSQ
jgi:hypothetical protein